MNLIGEEIFVLLFNILYLLINFPLVNMTQSFMRSIPPGRKLVNVMSGLEVDNSLTDRIKNKLNVILK